MQRCDSVLNLHQGSSSHFPYNAYDTKKMDQQQLEIIFLLNKSPPQPNPPIRVAKCQCQCQCQFTEAKEITIVALFLGVEMKNLVCLIVLTSCNSASLASLNSNVAAPENQNVDYVQSLPPHITASEISECHQTWIRCLFHRFLAEPSKWTISME